MLGATYQNSYVGCVSSILNTTLTQLDDSAVLKDCFGKSRQIPVIGTALRQMCLQDYCSGKFSSGFVSSNDGKDQCYCSADSGLAQNVGDGTDSSGGCVSSTDLIIRPNLPP